MNIVYIERLSLAAILYLIIYGKRHGHIFYFQESLIGKILSAFFSRVGLFKKRPSQVAFTLEAIKDEKGEHQYLKIIKDIGRTCSDISDTLFANNYLLRQLGKELDFKKIIHFFEKALFYKIKETITFLHIAKWHAQCHYNLTGKSIIYVIEKEPWSRIICHLSLRFGVTIVQRPAFFYRTTVQDIHRASKHLFQAVVEKLNVRGTKSGQKVKQMQSGIARVEKNNEGWVCIAGMYTGRLVTFDLKTRSEFFWFLKSSIPHEQILIYFHTETVTAPENAGAVLKEEGIRTVAFSREATTKNDIPLWGPGEKCRKIRRNLLRLLLKSVIHETMRLRPPSIFIVLHLLYFIKEYSFWYDFFTSLNIKINVYPLFFSPSQIPMNVALKNSGGISIAQQWSNLWAPSVEQSMYADVYFSFGPSYRKILENNGSDIATVIYSGYITDYNFKEVKQDALRLKEQLRAKGATFILSFFDENSSDDRMSLITNETSRKIYQFFINKMFEDKSIGLILKPSYVNTFHQRMSPILPLIEQAKKTGRCIIYEEGHYKTDRLPTEAAQASDLNISLLIGGTAALESYLSGIPTIMLDLEGFYSHPLYQQGKGKVVFDNLNVLFAALQQYRNNPKSIPGFGDLSEWAKDKDLFHDGRAAERVGQYLGWLLEKFNEKATASQALAYANENYRKTFGDEHVIEYRNDNFKLSTVRHESKMEWTGKAP